MSDKLTLVREITKLRHQVAAITANYADRAAEALAYERECERLRVALRSAPMPYRESVLKDEAWDDAYDEWWHSSASEAALGDGT